MVVEKERIRKYNRIQDGERKDKNTVCKSRKRLKRGGLKNTTRGKDGNKGKEDATTGKYGEKRTRKYNERTRWKKRGKQI
jgi:hypothetical protein